jgi:hypothetical protein
MHYLSEGSSWCLSLQQNVVRRADLATEKLQTDLCFHSHRRIKVFGIELKCHIIGIPD